MAHKSYLDIIADLVNILDSLDVSDFDIEEGSELYKAIEQGENALADAGYVVDDNSWRRP